MIKQKGITLLVTAIIIFVVVLIGCGVAFYYYATKVQPKSVACTMEAKICPDGSAVGRTGPNCEFTPCPDITASWKTYSNKEYGFELKYPETLLPDQNAPSAIVVDCASHDFPNKCPDSIDIQNKIRDFNPNTQPLNFNLIDADNDIKFCMASFGDGAAGTTYQNYFYLTVKDSKCIIVKIVIAYPNCQNYLPLEQGNTQQEQSYNNCLTSNQEKPKTLDKILSTFKFTN